MARTLGRAVSAVVVVACSIVPSSPAVADGGIEVSRIDTSALPRIVVEFTAPTTLTGGLLGDGDVAVLENGSAVANTLTVVPTSGLEVVLVIDTSGSMKEDGAMDAAKAAAARFLEMLPSEVAVGIVAFADRPRLVSVLTTDRALLNAAVDALEATGETALYDALVVARSMFSGRTSDRQIVLLSDGGNTVGSATADDALEVATEIRTSVVELTSSEADPANLQRLADANRGTRSAVGDPAALTGLFESIADSLLGRYRVEFDATATGDTRYTLTVATPTGQVEVAIATLMIEGPAPAADGSSAVPPTTARAPGATPGSTPAPTDPAPTAILDTPGGSPTAGSSPGSAETWLVVGAATCFVALLIGFSMVTLRRRDADAPRLIARIRPGGTPHDHSIRDRLTAAAERMLDRRGGRRRLAAALEVAEIGLRPGEFAVLCAAASTVVALLLAAMWGLPGVLIGVTLPPLAAWSAVAMAGKRRRAAFDNQLPDVLRMISTMLESGYGLPQALDGVAGQAAEPAAGEFQRVLLEVRIGRDPSDALAAIADRMQSTDFSWVVSAIDINREVGGELVTALDAIGEVVRERQRLERQVQALTAEGRLSAIILTALPLALVVLLSAVNPGYFGPMKNSPGPAMIVVAAGLLAGGWMWMRRIVKMDSGRR